MSQKKRYDFVTFSLPRDVVERIDSFIKISKNGDQLYHKRPDVVKVALARFFRDNGFDGGDVK